MFGHTKWFFSSYWCRHSMLNTKKSKIPKLWFISCRNCTKENTIFRSAAWPTGQSKADTRLFNKGETIGRREGGCTPQSFIGGGGGGHLRRHAAGQRFIYCLGKGIVGGNYGIAVSAKNRMRLILAQNGASQWPRSHTAHNEGLIIL